MNGEECEQEVAHSEELYGTENDSYAEVTVPERICDLWVDVSEVMGAVEKDITYNREHSGQNRHYENRTNEHGPCRTREGGASASYITKINRKGAAYTRRRMVLISFSRI